MGDLIPEETKLDPVALTGILGHSRESLLGDCPGQRCRQVLMLRWAVDKEDEDDDVILGEKHEVRWQQGNYAIVKLQLQPESPVCTTTYLLPPPFLASPLLSPCPSLGGLIWKPILCLCVVTKQVRSLIMWIRRW